MSSVKVTEQTKNEYFIQGVLDVHNVPELLEKTCKIIDQCAQTQHTEITFNFSQLQHSSSIGLALLTNLLRHANQCRLSIQFLHLPAKLWAAAKISNLDEILPCTQQS